ncbi:uncharacterized protein LOC131293016 [Anopheles ziemanni]|uniref:uncharacterized protein LOC131262346 n=1 Tax=Anopheles coustani TaxID=139045 RepID=UPI00265B5910|nr:uncharacterized protein LOC131262346 [Anopheles coustani]XP_058177078.1 uncharacterized protein LOC131293016 [Anopheles ziemanni]
MLNRQRLILAALVLLIVASCLFDGASARKHRSRKSSRPKGVNIEIYHPKGVLIWYPYRSGIEMFGIEIFINQANPNRDGSSSSEEVSATCDICLNTTEVSYGKFILRSNDAIIRSRDHVYYNAIVKKTSGKAYVARSNEFYVSESRILIADITGGASNSRDESSSVVQAQSGNLADKTPNALQQEVKLLEEILDELNQQCNLAQNQSRELLLSVSTETRLDAKDLHQFMTRQLSAKLPSIDWNRVLVDTYYTTNGIIFEVPTIVEKLKILKLAKKLPDQPIVDVDVFETEDVTNDIEAWLVE